MNYAIACILFLFELIIIYIFNNHHGKLFFQIIPIFMIAEVSYTPKLAKLFIIVKKFNREKISFMRLCYFPAAVGIFGFIGIGIGVIGEKQIYLVGIISAILCFLGKVLVIFYKNYLKYQL